MVSFKDFTYFKWNFLSKKLTLIFLILILSSCVAGNLSQKRNVISSKSTSTNTKAPTTLPTFTDGNNFIQNGGYVYTSNIALDLKFEDSISLRGKDVDLYIRNTSTQNISCLVIPFNDTSILKAIIVSATPRSVYNFSTKSVEYYFSLAPSDLTTNSNFCQKSGLINSLSTNAKYSNLSLKYQMKDLCPSGVCPSSLMSSGPIELFTSSGNNISQITLKHLNFIMNNSPTNGNNTGNSCSSSSECKTQGYDCCSLGQCIKDLALKPNLDLSSSDYLQAYQDILSTPSHIYNYPQYYYLCSENVSTPSNPTNPTDPINTANKRLEHLRDLYNCTTKLEGEMGICTVTYSNVENTTLIHPTKAAGVDDRSFANTYSNQSSASYTPTNKIDLTAITEVIYGEVTLFNKYQISDETILRNDPVDYSTYLRFNGHHNDDFSTGTNITLLTPVSTAISKDLVIRYQADASCIQLTSTLAKCEKYYVQGQQKNGSTNQSAIMGRVTDHYPASNQFIIPQYANTNKPVTVEVDGITQRQDLDWNLTTGTPASIDFISPTGDLKVFDSQKVKISFFVDTNVYSVNKSKESALAEISTICHCSGNTCKLAPLKNNSGSIVDYACVYPDAQPVEPPLSQKVYLSSKTVPVRYFDQTGTGQSSINANTSSQEGKSFYYRKDNLLNPNNITDILNPSSTEDTYIGFNEIYGSLSYATNSAKPAKEIAVKKGRSYDIYVDGGTYSNCVQCGNDYYSQLSKLFPLSQFAGGLIPFQSRTDRVQSLGIRADEFKFGRACFVPATMIPWTHALNSDPQKQRLNRLTAQHFLYANGYQNDWYGFDYGSLIGSFDGVKWFSIGSNRRIKADTNKLFLAVNGMMGDLALESTFAVTINDSSLNPNNSSMVTNDIDSDGAQCQKFHQCSNDNDCITSLGYEYVCASVNEITSSWPRFDENAKEIPDSKRDETKLTSILGISTTGKRCIYRGRGSLCTQNYLQSNLTVLANNASSYNHTDSPAFHSCSTNSYCQTFSTNSNLNNKFNNKISRLGKIFSDSSIDSFGMGARVAGRPFDYNGLEAIRSESLKNLTSNRANAMCIPGRNPESDTFNQQNGYNGNLPSNEYLGDKIMGLGMTLNSLSSIDSRYLSSCPVTDANKEYFYAKTTTPNTSNLTNTNLTYAAGSQNISTNALSIFKKSIFPSKSISFPILNDNSDILTSQTYTNNRCLRAPGASCFSNQECAPNKIISDKIKLLSLDDTTVTSKMNKYEIMFWQEELICSQATSKDDPTYSPSNNKCCREVGKTISLPSASDQLNIETKKVPGIGISMNTTTRYSRVATLYNELNTDSSNYPPLKGAIVDHCSKSGGCFDISPDGSGYTPLTNQYKTFSTYAERTSCSGDWIRNFANGNHAWDSTRLQTINPQIFRCFNWMPGAYNWSCAGLEADSPDCKIIQTTPNSAKALAVFNYMAKFDLLGIPQIAIESEVYFNQTTAGDMSCLSDPNNQGGSYPGNPSSPAATNYTYPKNLFKSGNVKEYKTAGVQLFSAVDANNFENMKQVFKSDEVVSCLPAGTIMPAGANPNLCCTGFINGKNNRCQLPDFVDISVYTNRYVSSEGKKLNVTLFDQSGFVKEPSYVAQMACEKSMCASGVIAFGVGVSSMLIPGKEDSDTTVSRFVEGSQADDESGILTLFKRGMKYNNHAYCFPASSANQDAEANLKIIPCSN